MKLAGWVGALAVLAGAFGAHGLREHPRIETWETAALYHLVHAVLLAVPSPPLARRLWLAGIVVFSGSLYLLVLLDAPWLGAVTPIGGLLLVAGWIALALRSPA